MVAAAKPVVPRKRNRRRKRRLASSSDESSSDDSSSEGSSPKPVPASRAPEPTSESDSDSSSGDDSSISSASPIAPLCNGRSDAKSAPRPRSPSPPPLPVPVPPFMPETSSEHERESDEKLKERFRKFWMESVVNAFQDDLGEIRKEPNLTTPRLALLIDSLASGVEVFTSSCGASTDINEMELT